MLLKAETLMESENQEDAEAILQEIASKYPNEWTGKKAASILNGLKEDNDNDFD